MNPDLFSDEPDLEDDLAGWIDQPERDREYLELGERIVNQLKGDHV